MYVYHINVVSNLPSESIRSPGTHGCEPSCGCSELNLGPLAEHCVLITTAESLHLYHYFLKLICSCYSWASTQVLAFVHIAQKSDFFLLKDISFCSKLLLFWCCYCYFLVSFTVFKLFCSFLFCFVRLNLGPCKY